MALKENESESILDLRFKSNVKIFAHPEWLKAYREGESVYPICWEVDASNNCHYSCDYCCWASYIENRKDMIPKEKLVELVREIKSLGGKSIIWSGGGDPLTNPHTAEAVQLANELGIENGMFTNGLGMNQRNAEVLARSLTWIRFHVGADNPEDFARIHHVPEKFFGVALDNIKRFVAIEGRKAGVGIGVAVNPENFESVKRLPDLSISLGVDFFQAKIDLEQVHSYDYMEWWFEEVVPYFEEVRDRLGDRVRVFKNTEQDCLDADYCHAHRIITAITADGRVTFCKMWRDDPKTSLGNIGDQSLKEIMDGDRHLKLAEAITAKTCKIYDAYCPYRKTIQAVDLYISDPEQKLPVPVEMPHINFF